MVDGDTFWFRGEKIRIADIDTPELSPPGCQRERELGLASKQRLLEILNSGPLSFRMTARDEDRFGRKLRIVYRERRSVGDILVAEGLARKWEGPRRSWCE
ncbi:thermonuclease family protein [Agrobacterium rosae]|uniref:thermonuclease family protein n=1 Tax=Agrobacterium rosae TaxID=1972867 RepID=UPI00387AE8B6